MRTISKAVAAELSPAERLVLAIPAGGQLLAVDSCFAGEWSNHLYVRRFMLPAARTGYDPYSDRRFWETDKDLANQGFCSAIPRSMLPVLERLASAKDLQVVIPGAEPALPVPTSRATSQSPLLQFLCKHGTGIVGCAANHVRPCECIIDAARAHPHSKILVLVRNHDQALEAYGQLSSVLPDVALATRKTVKETAFQVVISDGTALCPRIANALNDRSLTFVLDARQVATDDVFASLIGSIPGQLFGFLPSAAVLPPFERDRLAFAFGFPRLDLVGRHRELPQVHVTVLRHRKGANLAGIQELSDVKRRGVWHNHGRHRVIAKQAISLLGELVGGARRRKRPAVIGILVDNREHAKSLRRYLPGWRYLTEELEDDVICRMNNVVIDPPLCTTQGNVLGVVVPMTRPAIVPYLDVLIRADAGSGIPQWLSSVSAYRNLDLRVIDVYDRHHWMLAQAARQRLVAYKQAGWLLAGENPDPVAQFLSEHPPRSTDYYVIL